MSLASVTAQQNSTIANSATTTSGTSTAATSQTQSGNAALNSLSANFGDFLQLLMTQLQNQDPTSPLDTNEFAGELVGVQRTGRVLVLQLCHQQLKEVTEVSRQRIECRAAGLRGCRCRGGVGAVLLCGDGGDAHRVVPFIVTR